MQGWWEGKENWLAPLSYLIYNRFACFKSPPFGPLEWPGRPVQRGECRQCGEGACLPSWLVARRSPLMGTHGQPKLEALARCQVGKICLGCTEEWPSAQLASLSKETVPGLPPLELGSFRLDEMALNIHKRLQGRSRAKYIPGRDGWTSSPSRCGQPIKVSFQCRESQEHFIHLSLFVTWVNRVMWIFLFLDMDTLLSIYIIVDGTYTLKVKVHSLSHYSIRPNTFEVGAQQKRITL